MPLFHHRKQLNSAIQQTAQKTSTLKTKPLLGFFIKTIAWGAFFGGLFFLTFWKQTDFHTPLYLGQISKSRIIARVPFTYLSDIQTKALQEERRNRVSPVYRIDKNLFYLFSQKIEALQQILMDSGSKMTPEEMENFIKNLETNHHLYIEKNDIEALLRLTPTKRNHLLEEGLFVVQKTSQKGIHEEMQTFSSSNEGISLPFVTVEEAVKTLRMHFFSLTNEYTLTNTFVRIFQNGLQPNVVFDSYKTQEKIQKILEETPNVIVTIDAGDTIVHQDQKITPEIYERYQAYQQVLSQQKEYQDEQIYFFEKKIFLFVLFFALSFLWLSVSPSHLRTSKRLRIATWITLYLYLLLLRGIAFFCQSSSWESAYHLRFLSLLLVPTFLSSILFTTLIDLPAGFLLTFFTMGLKMLLLPSSLESFLCDLLIGWFMVFLCRKIHFKRNIFCAVFYAACLQANLVFLYSFSIQHLELSLCWHQTAAVFISAGITFFLAIFLTPLLEKAFRYTTNMTFLRLTNYNHPLLRKLQEIAPGTYHHSLMVAALSEKVASEIGANPLLCRCCSLYHDIGKMSKPNYFTENQSPGENPHLQHPPSVSAAILKNHIQEGILLAKRYHLPRIVRDVIRQHHGTFLMPYFYQKAQLLKKETETVDEHSFRYDGPQPHFKESAIIFLADAIEASSRTLEEPTPKAISELVNHILQDRLADGQLKDCTLTLKDLEIIRNTFQEALMNMLHTRVSYQKIEIATSAPIETQT